MLHVEVTDTFGGEANYSWVQRFTLPNARTRLAAVRSAKRAVGWSGIPCTVDSYGDTLAIRPRGMCQVMFITYDELRLTSNRGLVD